MQQLVMTTYHYKDGLDEDDYRALTKRFAELGTTEQVIAHYERLDGSGGFFVQRLDGDVEKDYEITLRYSPWIDFDATPVTTIEDAFPVISRVYG